MLIVNNKNFRLVRSKDYNYSFIKKTGYFSRWGKSLDDDPDYAPSPEILDIEISTICGKGCKFCYKSNTSKGKNMSLKDFKIIIDRISESGLLTQLAFGVGNIGSNPDLWAMAEYARLKDIVPNITINGERMNPQFYDSLVKYMGAVAVSRYNKDTCYNTVKELTNRGLKQVNIHQLLCEETIDQCFETLNDSLQDIRLKELNAIVFLLLKPKGRGTCLHQLKDVNKYKKLIDFALKNQIRIGFDSCGATAFLTAVQDHKNYKNFYEMAEPCESTLFSAYCSVEGEFFPCSFAEKTEGWESGLDMIHCNNFIEDIWEHSRTIKFRTKLLKTTEENKYKCRECPIYNLRMEK